MGSGKTLNKCCVALCINLLFLFILVSGSNFTQSQNDTMAEFRCQVDNDNLVVKSLGWMRNDETVENGTNKYAIVTNGKVSTLQVHNLSKLTASLCCQVDWQQARLNFDTILDHYIYLDNKFVFLCYTLLSNTLNQFCPYLKNELIHVHHAKHIEVVRHCTE